MHPGFRSILGLFAVATTVLTLLATVDLPIPSAAPSAPSSCNDQARSRAITLTVPVNGIASFGLDDLLVFSGRGDACFDAESLQATLTVAPVGEGTLDAVASNQFVINGDLPSAGSQVQSRFMFRPRAGFEGVSDGWQFSIHARGTGPVTEFGTVKVAFLIRNTLPVAIDDAVVVTPGLFQIDVPANDGLLANDHDSNGDRMSVYAHGVTRFVWGTVEIRRDGSFRVKVTDHTVVPAEAHVPYVVWDNQGSPTSTDAGTLTIRFHNG